LPPDCGFKIQAGDRTEAQVIADLAEAMRNLAGDSALRSQFAANALAAARLQTWPALVGHAYHEIENMLAPK
jgi:hypothetical protein